MAEGHHRGYEEALKALYSLVVGSSHMNKTNRGDRFDLLFEYIKMLDLEEPMKQLKIIHVAGTKGKGSTCAFAESILRNCGFHTGLFSSPHLIDIRERIRLDGVDISKEKFAAYFWWCWDRLKERTNDEVPMPDHFFTFLALLAFKIFATEQVDVAIIEVGLGGKTDSTNVIEKPIVCGISSLGYDHMEILGSTIGEIAEQKAGIFKGGVPAFTVPQPMEAMRVLQETASQLNVLLHIVEPLNAKLLNGLHLGLEGDHQYLNAGLAVALCSCWLQTTFDDRYRDLNFTTHLPEQFIKALATVNLQGRAQILSDKFFGSENLSGITYCLDAAHTPESMEVCGKWFSQAIRENYLQQTSLKDHGEDGWANSHESAQIPPLEQLKQSSMQILLFNCMKTRDPEFLFPHLIRSCANQGVNFTMAIFVPDSSAHLAGTTAIETSSTQVDLSWQLKTQRVWEKLISGSEPKNGYSIYGLRAPDIQEGVCPRENSIVFPSVLQALTWLRETARDNASVCLQVLVTGSLRLLGDVLRSIQESDA